MVKIIKLNLFVMLLALAISITGCKKNDDELTELISFNLLRMGGAKGSIDPALLVGEWNIVKFAYTANGNKISNVADIPIKRSVYDYEWSAFAQGISIDEAIDRARPKLIIPEPLPIQDELEKLVEYGITPCAIRELLILNESEGWSYLGVWGVSACLGGSFACMVSGNLMKIKDGWGTGYYCPEQKGIISAFANAHSFVIKGDELIIYFTGDKKKNLLIFKKR